MEDIKKMNEKKPLKLKLKKKPLKLKLKKRRDEGSAPADSQPVVSATKMSLPVGGGIQIILKNAKIHAEKVIIKKIEKK